MNDPYHSNSDLDLLHRVQGLDPEVVKTPGSEFQQENAAQNLFRDPDPDVFFLNYRKQILHWIKNTTI